MMLLLAGANHRTAPMALREKLALPKERLPAALRLFAERFGAEAVLVSTCNRAELYLARPGATEPPAPDEALRAVAELHQLTEAELRPAFFFLHGEEAVRHLFRVSASLDSIVLGEAQISGQVREAYETAAAAGTAGPLLHQLFRHTRQVAKRIRGETKLTAGKVSVASLAIDYLREVFDRFDNKTVLVIGAGKIGELTLRQLAELKPRAILAANRSAEKAAALAASCGGQAVPWEQLDAALAKADIILSATGAAQPVITKERFAKLAPLRAGRPAALLDLAVPRDIDPAVADLDEVDLLVNIDDFQRIREKALRERERQAPAAEQIVAAETERFLKEWSRRWTGPAIAKLSQEWDAIRAEVERQCLGKLNGKLTAADKETVAGALRLLQNKLMHAPLAVLQEEAKAGAGRGLLDALAKLFRLGE